MVLNSRGQFFLVGMVAMVIIVCGMAYFATEAKELSRLTGRPQEKAMEAELDQYEATLMQGLEAQIFTGNASFVGYVVHECNETANKTWRDLTTECLEQTSGLDFMLNCTLTLESETQNISRTFNNTYSVPINITLYSDPNLATEATTFFRNDVIYYKVTGENGKTYNVTFLDPSVVLRHSNKVNTVNYFANNSYTLAADAEYGSWPVYLNYSGTGVGTLRKQFTVSNVQITFETYDEANNPTAVFNAGDMVKAYVIVNVDDAALVVRMDVVNAWGRQTEYGSEGTRAYGDGLGNSVYYMPFTISSTEASGTMTIWGTEQEQFVTDSTTITVN